MKNRHQPWDLAQMQSLPLEAKIQMTKRRIEQWYEHYDGQVYVSFSGGKDSTVLKHIVDSMYSNVPAVFIDTGLEFPEIRRFVKEIQSGKYDCFNSNVESVRPKMRFDEVTKEYGYPIISKEVAEKIYYAQMGSAWALNAFKGLDKYGNHYPFRRPLIKYAYLIESNIPITARCCHVMKKNPIKQYERDTRRRPILGTMANESQLRKQAWLKNGCNAFNSKRPISQPLSFWTKQDILHYIKQFAIPYASIYGEIVEENGVLKTTGYERTGCVFCGFGCHLEKEPNRFQKLKETHPKLYNYCINGGEMVDGKWQPNKEGLGLGYVLDYIGVKY